MMKKIAMLMAAWAVILGAWADTETVGGATRSWGIPKGSWQRTQQRVNVRYDTIFSHADGVWPW